MQMIAKSMKFCFYMEHAPKSDRGSGLNLSFDENKKINFALRFLKYVARFALQQRPKTDIKFVFIVKFTRSLPLKNL